ncbi:MAG: ABC transporter ATP-binding protein [Bacillota bacterium]
MKVEIKSLSKNYGSNAALKGISLDIPYGMFGLLGPNGAGKTTLMRILTTLIEKTDGIVKLGDIDIGQKKRIRELVGYLPQEFSMYAGLTVYEAMDYLAVLSYIQPGARRKELINELLERVNLERYRNTRVRALSGGMKRRLGIAQALLNDPKLLIVDEPTAGLDPEERIRFRNLLRDFSDNRIVILSTHIVEDIEFTCEKLAILDKGTIVYNGEVRELLKRAEGNIWAVLIERDQLEDIRKKHTIISSVSEGENIRLKLLADAKPLAEAAAVKPTLEDAYMSIIKGVS